MAHVDYKGFANVNIHLNEEKKYHLKPYNMKINITVGINRDKEEPLLLYVLTRWFADCLSAWLLVLPKLTLIEGWRIIVPLKPQVAQAHYKSREQRYPT